MEHTPKFLAIVDDARSRIEKNVWSMDGGYREWTTEGYPIDRDEG